MSFPSTADEALRRAEDWACGRLSHNNIMLTMEQSPDDRTTTLAQIEFMDAQEVVKWSALAVAMSHVRREEKT